MTDIRNTLPRNPAARLKEVVDRARTISPNIPALHGWQQLFGSMGQDMPGMLSGLNELARLVRETRVAIEGLPEFEHALYLRPILKFEEVLSHINFDNSWNAVLSAFDDATTYGLSITADILDKFSKEPALTDERLAKLIFDLETVEEELESAELPEDLHNYILNLLERVRNAILNYRIFGPEYVSRIIEHSSGSLILNRNRLLPFISKPAFVRLFTVLQSVSDIVTTYQGAQLLGSGLAKLLESAK